MIGANAVGGRSGCSRGVRASAALGAVAVTAAALAGDLGVNWRERCNQMRAKVAQLRKDAKLDENPEYRLDVKDEGGVIRVEREPYTLVFDKQRAMVTEATIAGQTLKAVRLPHLLIIGGDGKELRQSDSTAGELKVRPEKFSVFLEGFFTLGGQRVPIVYEIDRMTGTTFCTLDVPGPLKVRRLTLEHTLGPTPRPLDVYYAPHRYLRKFEPYQPTVINEYKIDEIFEKDTMQFWTDGVIGLQVFSITWDGARVADAEKKYRYGTGEIHDNASWANLTFFSTGTDEAVELPKGYKVTCAFSPMPFKQWRPKSELFASAYYVPGGIPKDEQQRETDGILDDFARCGVTLMCAGAGAGTGYPDDPDLLRYVAADGHRKGVKTILYIERSLANRVTHPKLGLLTEDELLAGCQELVSHFGATNNGNPQWGDVSPMCCNYEPWRIHLLTMIDYYLAEMDFDGCYLDSSFVCSCHNVRHGESPDESTSVRGTLTFMQDLRLLMDDYARRNKREYTVINHYWNQHSAPGVALADYVLPGELHAGAMLKQLPPAEHLFSYSPIPTGMNMIWYSSRSYDYTSPLIFDDAADCGGQIWLSYYQESVRDHPPLGVFLHQRHVQPLAQWDTRGSRPIHRFSAEYGKLFTAPKPSTRALIYQKDDSWFVNLVDDGPENRSVACAVALPAAWTKVLVLNADKLEWSVAECPGGKLSLQNVDCSSGPAPIVVRPYPTAIGLNWRDAITRHVTLALEPKAQPKTVVVEATGVAGARGACYLEVPDGLSVKGQNREMVSAGPRIFIVPLVFDENGRAKKTLEVIAKQ